MEDGTLYNNGDSKFVLSVKLPSEVLERIMANSKSVKFHYGDEPKLVIDGINEYSFSCTEAKLQICILQQNNNYTEVGSVAKKLTMDSSLTMEDRLRIKNISTEAEKQRKERKTVFLGSDNNSNSRNSNYNSNSNISSTQVKRKPNFVSLPKPIPSSTVSSYSSSTQVIPPPPTIPSVANISTTSREQQQQSNKESPIPTIIHSTPSNSKDSIVKDTNISGGSNSSNSSGSNSNNGTPFSPQLNYSSSTPSPGTSLSPEYHTPNRSPNTNSSKSTSSPRLQFNNIKEQDNSSGSSSNNSSKDISFLSLEKESNNISGNNSLSAKPTKKKPSTPIVPLGLKGEALERHLLQYLPLGITNQILKSRYELDQPNNNQFLNKVAIFKSPGVWLLKDEYHHGVSLDWPEYKSEDRDQVRKKIKEALSRYKGPPPEPAIQSERDKFEKHEKDNNSSHINNHYSSENISSYSNGLPTNKLNLNNLNGHLDRNNDSISPRNKYQQVNKKQRIIPPPASVKNNNSSNNNNNNNNNNNTWLSVNNNNSNNNLNENDSNSSRSNSPILSPSGSPNQNKSNELLPWSTKSTSTSVNSNRSNTASTVSNKKSQHSSRSSKVQERESNKEKEREREIKEKEREIKEKEREIKEKEREHREKEREIKEKERELKEREREIREHKERDSNKEKVYNSELNEVLPSLNKIPLSNNVSSVSSSVSSSSSISSNSSVSSSSSIPMITKPHSTIIPKVSTGFLSKLEDRKNSLDSQLNQESSTPSSNSRPNSARGSDNSLKRKIDSIRQQDQNSNNNESATTTPISTTPIKPTSTSTSTSTSTTPIPSATKLTSTSTTSTISTTASTITNEPIECIKDKLFIINNEDDFKLMLQLSKSKYQRYTQIHKFITNNIQDFQQLQRDIEACDNSQQRKEYTDKIFGLYYERKEKVKIEKEEYNRLHTELSAIKKVLSDFQLKRMEMLKPV